MTKNNNAATGNLTISLDDILDDDITYNSQVITSNYTFDTNTMSSYGDLVIAREGKEPIRVAETLEQIMDRLAIIVPDLEKMEKYPALKEAYENYKLVESLIKNDTTL